MISQLNFGWTVKGMKVGGTEETVVMLELDVGTTLSAQIASMQNNMNTHSAIDHWSTARTSKCSSTITNLV